MQIRFPPVVGTLLVTALFSVTTRAQVGPGSPPPLVQADVRTYGDPSLRAAVDTHSHSIYDVADKPDAKRISLMTRGNPLSFPGAEGTEATGVLVEGSVGRIVVNVWTKRGRYSVEYYRAQDTLLFVYETFAYFEERAPRHAWRNFMGLAVWERRSYFDERNRIGFAESRGADAPPPGSDGTRLIAQAERLAKLIQERVKSQTR
jgi:hypothetical protein